MSISQVARSGSAANPISLAQDTKSVAARMISSHAVARPTGGIGQHRHPGDRYRTGRACRRDRDNGGLFGGRIRDDRAVAVGEHLVARHIKKMLDTVDTSAWVLMISNADRTVWAVVCAAPETMPSTILLCTSMVPK